MTTAELEDQNIATLREYFDDVRPPDETCAALSALASALAERDRGLDTAYANLSDAADRIRALEYRVNEYDKALAVARAAAPPAPAPGELGAYTCRSCGRRSARLSVDGATANCGSCRYTETLEAPPATAPGGLAEALKCVRLNLNWSEALDRVYRAAESWQRLQWRPASEATLDVGEPVVFRMPIVNNGRPDVDYWVDSLRECEAEDENEATVGVYLDLTEDHGWDWEVVKAEAHCIRLHDLPALNGGDDNG
jgi:hypothetical protein